MRLVSIDKFVPYVQPYADKCPAFAIRRAVRDTIIDLAERVGTSTLRFSLDAVAGEHTYELDLPYGTEVDQLRKVVCGNTVLKATNRDLLSHEYPNTDWKDIPGTPRFYMCTDDPRFVSIIPAPAKPETLTFEAKIRFCRDATEFPSEYYERYVEVVGAGALTRLLAIPGQTFTDLGAAAQWAQIYAARLNEIQINTLRDFTNEAGRVVYRDVL